MLGSGLLEEASSARLLRHARAAVEAVGKYGGTTTLMSPDSRRYAACGDGVVANVAEWIGRGIMEQS
jgi:hypothetical protein